MNRFKENLKELRKETGLTQKSLGESVGILERTVSYLESGKRECDIDTLIKLSDFFGVTVDELVR